MLSTEEVLLKYFGHNAFRDLQKDIISNVLEAKDTIALLPTGGGKSICFQVPALMLNGVCIVISPLIALMKDQVENLKARDINAVALYSGMSRREIEFELENCINGKYKFLYISPERLMSQHFLDYAINIKVSMLAIDEAHCISQWGYDFRPPYLEIAKFKIKYAKIPCIALTATATAEVIKDIEMRLDLCQPKIFTQSFVRKNLSYVVQQEENKIDKILLIANKIKGTGLIYVRSRKKTVEIAALLKQKNVNADFYHAGLEAKIRNQKQEDWKKNKTRIIVCTNAFGMGIDKPDVRFVIHEQKPDTIEAYYQEAGRAGRDGKKSYCVFLHHPSDDTNDLLNITTKYPESKDIERIYHLITTYLNIAVGSGKGHSYNFNINEFCDFYKLNITLVYNSIKILEHEAYFQLTESIYIPSRLKIICSYQTLYEWQVQNKDLDLIFKTLIRSYGGVFDYYTNIYEKDLAIRTKQSDKWIKAHLTKYHELELIDYIPQNSAPQIIMLENRFSEMNISSAKIDFLRNNYRGKLKAVNNYIENKSICRSKILVSYFEEKNSSDCGVCDICLEKNRFNSIKIQFEKYYKKINVLIIKENFRSKDLPQFVNTNELDEYVLILRWLKDNNYAKENTQGYWEWAKKRA